MNPLTAAAERLGLSRDDLIPYGHDLAKVPLSLLDRPKSGEGKLVLVSAITPTPAGEGKTTTTIGLTDALNGLGLKACAALREPSPFMVRLDPRTLPCRSPHPWQPPRLRRVL